ncbi:MAG: nitronate monooxygenase, partial [Acidimicrobiales bacterium]
TVTTPDEAVLAQRAGADCLCLQGAEAGAHRGSFTNDTGPAQDHPRAALLARVRGSSDLPLIAAGGLGSPHDVAAVLAAGATQAQLGTAFLRCTESGAHPLYKAALADPRFSSTAITRAFSGRRARSLVNDFMRAHEDAPAAYPEVNNATRPLRTAALAAGDVQRMSLYAGEGFRAAEQRSAGEIIERLASGIGRSPRP